MFKFDITLSFTLLYYLVFLQALEIKKFSSFSVILNSFVLLIAFMSVSKFYLKF